MCLNRCCQDDSWCEKAYSRKSSILHHSIRSIAKKDANGILKFQPQEDAADVYQLVRLGAGTLH